MVGWPDELESRFYSIIRNLNDDQCNRAIEHFSIMVISQICPRNCKSIFSSDQLNYETIMSKIRSDGDEFWKSVDKFMNKDHICQSVLGYLFWASRDHYHVDSAMEILDDLVDLISNDTESLEIAFKKLFSVIDLVKG